MKRTGARDNLLELLRDLEPDGERVIHRGYVDALEAEARDREALRLARRMSTEPGKSVASWIVDIRADVKKRREGRKRG